MTLAVSIRNISVAYDKHPALDDVTLDIAEGEFVGIIGPNGGGKSTLVKAILGLVPLRSGTIRIFGEEIRSGRKNIGYVPQFADVDRKFPITVLEVVMTSLMKGGLRPFFRYTKEHRERARAVLAKVGIEKLADRRISDLSGGEFQRVLIARALAAEPKILLLDEPDASIDPASREHIYNLLSDLNREITIILVTHDVLAISTAITSVVCLNREILYHGPPSIPDTVYHKMYGGMTHV
ncbi:MAG TPA: ABC transporter ATP-binding protein [Methanocorpusculum sp.]|nr:ABC transporter ATP-binding protein [Methanocorpusculum sp.]